MSNEIMTLGERLKQKRIEMGLSQQSVADKSGITQGAIANIEKRKTKSSPYAENIAKALGVSLQWLITGQGEESNKNVSTGPELHNQVPLLGRVSAGNFIHTRELESHEVETWLMSPKDYKGQAFGLRIEGDSMTSPVGKSYPDGGIAVFNSGNKSPNNGDLVLAKIAGSDEITFKKYVEDAGNHWLMPLNPNYPRIDAKFNVLAVFEYAIVY